MQEISEGYVKALPCVNKLEYGFELHCIFAAILELLPVTARYWLG
jgi:hypothetical protein